MAKMSSVAAKPNKSRTSAAAAGSKHTTLEVAGHEVRLSNPDKLFFPKPKFTKLDLAEYYNPRLTTIAQPVAEIAQSTARVLLATMRDPARAIEQVWIRGRLVEGASVGAPPSR